MRLSLDHLGPAQRRLVFILIMVGGVMLLAALTLLLIALSAGAAGRTLSVGLIDGVSAREFAALPDDDAYPESVAAAPDGVVYAGSYATGAIWRINPDGIAEELPNTRDRIGAAAGLVAAPDGTLYVIDQEDSDPRTPGGVLLAIAPDGTITTLTDLADEGGFVTADDVTRDSQGRLYVTDRGRNQVWRIAADGSDAEAWYTPPDSHIPDMRGALTGIAYDAANDLIYVTDPDLNRIYRVEVESGAGEIVYQHDPQGTAPPGFDGITVGADGTVYAAAFGQNGVVRLIDDTIEYLAGNFRGASDVTFAAPNRLYVTNFDQTGLVIPWNNPQLPFALDLIELPE